MRTIEDIDEATAAFNKSTMHSDLIMAKIEDLTQKKKPITSKGNKPLYVWEQFAVVLKRNLFFYARNPFNVLARSITVLFLGIITGLIWLGAASPTKNQDPFRFFNIGGGMFACLFSQLLIPFSSMSLFIYDRKFYSRESAVKLYSPSIYFLANMTLEGTLHTLNALMYTLIVFHLIDLKNFWGYFGVMAIIVHIGNCMIQFFCLITTNQDQAFAIATAYVAVAIATGGFLAPYPYLYENMLWLQWFSVVKYPFQILVYQQLSSPLTDVYLNKLEMDRPSSWQANAACMLAFYAFFYTGGFLGLRYLNREKR